MARSLSAHYLASPISQYHVAATKVAVKISKAVPAVDPSDPVPTFNAAQCSIIMAEIFGIPRADVLKDLVELSKRV